MFLEGGCSQQDGVVGDVKRGRCLGCGLEVGFGTRFGGFGGGMEGWRERERAASAPETATGMNGLQGSNVPHMRKIP